MYTVMVEMIGMDLIHVCGDGENEMDGLCSQLQGVIPLQECWKSLNWTSTHSEEPDLVLKRRGKRRRKDVGAA